MRRLNVPVLLALMVLSTACGDLLSLHALYTTHDQVFDSALEGRWEREDDRLLVQRVSDGYTVTAQDKHDTFDSIKYEAHLADVNGVRFADLRQEDTIGHMFVRVRVAEGQLHLAFLDAKWLRDRVQHEDADIEEGKARAVLTLPTARLRQLIGRFASEPRAYDDELVYGRPQ